MENVKAKNKNNEFFDHYATSWDTDRRIKRAEIIAKEIIKEISQLVDDTSKYKVIEYGCGTGLISFNLHNYFKDIILIDSSSTMIEVLRHKIKKANVSHMTPYKIDLSNNDHEQFNNEVDLIYSSMVLHHIRDIEEILKQFYDLLKKDGYIMIVDLDEEDGQFHKNEPEFVGHNGFDHKKLKNRLKRVGFRNVTVHTFYNNVKIINGEEVNYSLFIMIGKR
ncbi:class I SAM-dependent methyltransferase [Haloplasma contractile]|uniref:Ubiquinone-menaquinone biosynthesis methyltransferase protein n=1 Tax=Haloplasma contractile SSD-17B TaxID=1033810 RepID=F7Q0Z9_9MOLU|nr:class I SAM-dependent methyltransferase [Haloplasma contractile]ERJ11358.1 ubiquinone-menaquinone biosynthesis methyltransferase protein [Haloplasma contractile SSD-17B]